MQYSRTHTLWTAEYNGQFYLPHQKVIHIFSKNNLPNTDTTKYWQQILFRVYITVKPLLSRHPLLSGHLGRSRRCPLNRGFTVLKYFYYPSSIQLYKDFFSVQFILTGYLINENLIEMASDFYFSRNFIWLLWVVFSSQQHHRKKERKKQEKVNGNPLFFPVRLNRLAINAIQWCQYSFALIHAKSKTWFSSGKPRNIAWKCQHDTELLYFFQS